MNYTPHQIPELNNKGLREFGLVTGGIIAALFGLFFPWVLDMPIPAWPWALSGILILWGLIAPKTLRPIYRGWMRFGLLMGRITTPLIMGIVFFGVILPPSIIMKLAGRDPMARMFNKKVDSYLIKSRIPSKENMERPF